jgi:hypothetical protein
MQQKGCEKQNLGYNRDTPGPGNAPRRINRVKVGGEGKRDQQGDDKPAIVQANFDTANMSELDLGAHKRAAFLSP